MEEAVINSVEKSPTLTIHPFSKHYGLKMESKKYRPLMIKRENSWDQTQVIWETANKSWPSLKSQALST